VFAAIPLSDLKNPGSQVVQQQCSAQGGVPLPSGAAGTDYEARLSLDGVLRSVLPPPARRTTFPPAYTVREKNEVNPRMIYCRNGLAFLYRSEDRGSGEYNAHSVDHRKKCPRGDVDFYALFSISQWLHRYRPGAWSLAVTVSQLAIKLRSQSRKIPRPVAVAFPPSTTSLAATSGSPVNAIANQYNSSTLLGTGDSV